MKNKEKFATKIVEIACKGHDFRVDKNTNEVEDCCDAPCTACLFLEMKDCDKARREWAESEYIEKSVIVISKRDRVFLEYLGEEFKYIVRHRDGTLFAYKDGLTNWFSLNCRFDVDFPMVKWEGNEEVWLIEDLKKLEVVEEYEENSKKKSK